MSTKHIACSVCGKAFLNDHRGFTPSHGVSRPCPGAGLMGKPITPVPIVKAST